MISLDDTHCLLLALLTPAGSIPVLMERFGGALNESTVRKYTRQLLEGLQYLHDKGEGMCGGDFFRC